MKFVIQRVSQASVTIDNSLYAGIEKGFLVLIGICNEDTKETADKMVKKLIGLRIFQDGEGKTNLSLKDVGGGLLLVSQETVLLLSRPAARTMPINSMIILSTSAKKRSPWWAQGSLARI